MRTATRSWPQRMMAYLPRGHTLPCGAWTTRHRAVVILLWVHVPLLFLLGVYGGTDRWFTGATFEALPLAHVVLEVSAIAMAAAVASMDLLGRRVRSVVASFGLVTSSALLTHFSGGFIEAHFHFFVMVAVIAMYQDWVPFLFSIAYVALHHGIAGTLDPTSVFNHPAALANPWAWAGVHAVFLLGISAAEVVNWRLSERLRDETMHVLESAGDAIIGTDATGRITFVNQAVVLLTGLPEDRLVGGPVQEVSARITPVDPTSPRIGDTITKGVRQRDLDAQYLREDGVQVPIEWVCTPILDRGEVRGAVLTLRDLTARKTAEAELRESHSQAAQAEKMATVGTLVAGVAHEINNPLAYVNTNEHLARAIVTDLVAQTRDDVTAKRLVELQALLAKNQEGIRRIHDIVGSLRTIAHPADAEHRPEDLQQIVESTLPILHSAFRDASVRLAVAVPHGPVRVLGNATELSQVLLNFTKNALEVSQRGDTVRVRLATEGDEAVLAVTDEGPGVAREVQERIFKTFYTTKRHGTGLGLAISDRIATAHGGRLVCRSEPGEGATFELRLPRAADPVAESTSPLASRRSR